MPEIRVAAFSLSIDGYGAGPDQGLDDPVGRRGEELHRWMLPTRTFRAMIGETGGSAGVDDDFAARSLEGFGAFVLGRNMFAPFRGEWPDRDWKGWWGDDPPYHAPTFVLTHFAREPEPMQGGTTFHFETGGIEATLDKAVAAAGDNDVRVLGGVSTVRQCLAAGRIDRMHLAIAPIALGSGEAMFEGLDLPGLGFRVRQRAEGERATHVILER